MRPLVRDRNAAITLGLLAWLTGTILLWDAFEHRGKGRPLGLKITQAGTGLL